jgi:hypothetical protein
MSKRQILDDLPKLSPNERSQVFARLAELHEADLVAGAEPLPEERRVLDAGLKGYVAQEFVPKRPDPLASLRQGVLICDV